MTEHRYLLHPTPVGDVLIVTAGDRLQFLSPLHESVGAAARLSSHRGDAVVPGSSKVAEKSQHQLDEYFAGRRREFSLPLEWDGVHGFTRAALAAVCRIPYGETAGYGEVAVMAGAPGAARAVGTACSRTPFSIVVPVHRVVRADGSIGEYGGHPEVKARLLALEDAASR